MIEDLFLSYVYKSKVENIIEWLRLNQTILFFE